MLTKITYGKEEIISDIKKQVSKIDFEKYTTEQLMAISLLLSEPYCADKEDILEPIRRN